MFSLSPGRVSAEALAFALAFPFALAFGYKPFSMARAAACRGSTCHVLIVSWEKVGLKLIVGHLKTISVQNNTDFSCGNRFPIPTQMCNTFGQEHESQKIRYKLKGSMGGL